MKRMSGILLHPVSLPAKYGIGDFGESARAFVDFLVEAGQSVWQVLPLGPTGYGDSPYNALSAFAGNPLLIDLEGLVKSGDLLQSELKPAESNPSQINYVSIQQTRKTLFRKAVRRFACRPEWDHRRKEYALFCAMHSDWLHDFALFLTLRDKFKKQTWAKWPEEAKSRQRDHLNTLSSILAEDILFHKYLQFVFYEQWDALKTYASERGIKIMGDMPIFVAYDSADVWSHQNLFQLDESGHPKAVAGVPPDYFSATGQLWGNPLYDWTAIRRNGFDWWLKRFRHKLQMVDLLRVDHFRGFESCWSVPTGEKTAINGHWEKVPGRELFQALCKEHPSPPIIAEDLGVITAEVEAMRDEFLFPGMRVLQFAFDSGPDNPHLPQNHVSNCVVYTGTHDNNTIVGWWQSLPKDTKKSAKRELQSESPDIPWDFIALAMSSIANLCILPCQDVLGLGQWARFNHPGQPLGNWQWRLNPGDLDSRVTKKLYALTARHSRI